MDLALAKNSVPKQIPQGGEQPQTQSEVNVVTFNCKNVNTSGYVLDQLSKSADVILLQEHWLFDCKLHRLKEISSGLTGCGKAVDTGNPILPVQMPRGYGGTGILWSRDLDHLVTMFPDGGNRIQCIQLRTKMPLLLVSVYMPCRGLTDNLEDYLDCLDQLNEIMLKFGHTHSIVLGGDFNEDLVQRKGTSRVTALQSFIQENNLRTHETTKTFIAPDGRESTTLDYIFYSENLEDDVLKIESLETIHINVSDHIPVQCKLRLSLERAAKKEINLKPSNRIRWDKIDNSKYAQSLEQSLQKLDLEANTVAGLDDSVLKLNLIISKCAQEVAPKAVKRPRKARLRVWTPQVQDAVRAKKKAFHEWKQAGRPASSDETTVVNKKHTTKMLRQICRIEYSNEFNEQRQAILDTKSRDMALFHKLINRQRGKLSNCINELHVNDRVYKTDADILNGWRQHFEQLASPCFDDRFDKDYEKLVALELNEIIDLCDRDPLEYEWITQKEVSSAIKSLNKGKSPDLYNVTAEHLIKGEQQLVPVLTILLNKMLQLGTVPDSLKLGILTPVFKKKGSNLDSKNYRGITVNPTVTKVLETVLRERINPLILRQQNSLQRGFTEGSAPMNCSLILEESIRNNRDQKLSTHVAFLDAKSAFDVVNHSSLMRKLYHTGVDGVHWNLIHNLHSNARAAVKWNNAVSDEFPVKQGVRQGGILSTDLFKVYNNEMLNRMVDSGLGTRIGAINCVAPTCADDVALSSDRADDLQSLINIGVDYSELEKFQLQPTKSVVLSHLTLGDKNRKGMEETWTMYGEPMPVVTEASHMGILRSHCTEESAVRDNIKKARRTLYSLMSSGLHGQNGLDPETSIQLLNIYVLPILVYGLEVILPKPKYLNMLERFFKKMLKQVMSLPTTVADCAVYAVSGT
ncbi:MAG: reverse transcriptase family protein, partial [Candidatus Thiodiazotropha taylori]|nr:reverse transcriptase family protein [Candidatus Thiodiazotropha taylori]MCW4334336.1 reverse transcriptase family protein [Candidatus Thiodiazotropha endolucinida]